MTETKTSWLRRYHTGTCNLNVSKIMLGIQYVSPRDTANVPITSAKARKNLLLLCLVAASRSMFAEGPGSTSTSFMNMRKAWKMVA